LNVKNYLPRSLFGRTLLIVVMPLIILQVVAAFIFYRGHWETVSRHLARNLAGDVAVLVDILQDYPQTDRRSWMAEKAARQMGIFVTFKAGEVLPNGPGVGGSSERTLRDELAAQLGRPFRIDGTSLKDHVVVEVQLADGVIRMVANRKRLFSATTYVFVLWMVGTSLILFAVASIFMRNQVKPILRLARAAEDFGKGRDVPQFKPEGAKEVRQAASAFIAMRERLRRQIGQRTDLLTGVSHDLRTPLTRMKLQLAMMSDADGSVAALHQDVTEMERMLEGYLAFARGEGTEKAEPYDVSVLLAQVVRQARRKGGEVTLDADGPLVVPLRQSAFQRCVTNLVSNAMRYGQHVAVHAGRRGQSLEIVVDDDGPGIPEDKREEVFRPFYRLEGSRNPGTGGIGLGLTIARDVVRSHGGEIMLDRSPAGGLRARVRLPL
jgi:two-component system osmolarity sensor histidine kinase EnvZ